MRREKGVAGRSEERIFERVERTSRSTDDGQRRAFIHGSAIHDRLGTSAREATLPSLDVPFEPARQKTGRARDLDEAARVARPLVILARAPRFACLSGTTVVWPNGQGRG